MGHNRKLVLSGIGLTIAKLPTKKSLAALTRVRDELEQEIIRSGYLTNAPFVWVGISIRKGLVDETEPHYDEIDANDGELPLAIEIDTHRLLDATEDEMVAVYRRATLLALLHAGARYQLRTERLRLLAEA
jgi:hypothetical protein